MGSDVKIPIVPIGLHSYFSLGWGIPSPEAICEKVKSFGQDTIVITDRDNLYGLIFIRNVARDYGLKVIYGAEVTSPDGEGSLFVLVRNRTGYSNLCQILTDRHIDPDFNLTNAMISGSEGLEVIATIPEQIERLVNCVESLWAGLRRGRPNRRLMKAAEEHSIESVALVDSYWIEPDDSKLHRLIRAISMNKTLSTLLPSECAVQGDLLTPDEFKLAFHFSPEAVENTRKISDRCDFTPDFGIVYPPIPDQTGETADQQLRRMAYRGALWRYGEITGQIRTRLEYELGVIAQKQFAPVFLVVEDIVRQAPRTCGRGSAAASVISYCLGITHVDPIRHRLFFERFISPARRDPPDIDIDFPWDERDGVIEYVFRKYGETYAAMVANHNSFQSRASIHEIAKVYGLTEAEITTITKRLGGGYGWLGIPVTEHPALADHGFSHPWPEILALAQRLEDIPRHLSVHCGGVVITPQPTSNWVPTQVAAKGVRIVHWEKDQTEDSGLVKIDLLGNRSLAVIRDAKEAAKKHHNVLIDYNQDNPIDDPATQALMASGDTMGVFYVESPSARMLQKKAAMGDYEHLVLHTSIIRPAANKFINLYLERLKGAHWEPLHPAIGDILDENYGLMIYQEDVTRVAMRLAGFPHAEADELRKILSQKHKKRRLKELMEQFYAGAAEQGASREQIDQIWEMIMSFAGYSFCKPHSASYALVSYQSGWLKAHFPAEFIAAVLSNQGGYYAAFAYVSEAKRMGLSVQPPDINLSDIRYSGADDWLRIGLMQIKGLSNLTMERIVLERMSNGNYRSMDDCISRVGLTETETELLIKAGCFDRIEVGRTRPELLWEAIAIDHHSGYDQRRAKRVIGSNSYSEQSQLFDDEIEVDVLPKPPQYNARTLLQAEIETLGFLVSCHPLDLYKDRLKSRPVVPASELGRCDRQHVEVAGWLVTSKLVLTKYRDPMEFVTFEDTTGLIETVFFPETFKRFSHILSYTRPYRLSGQVNIEHSVITLNVDRVEFL